MKKADKIDEFESFCFDQIEQLGIFREFSFKRPAAVAAYADWLMKNSDGDRDKAKRIMSAALELDQLPDVVDLRRIRDELYPKPPAREASEDCPYCAGSAFEEIERDGVTGVKSCRCGGVPRIEHVFDGDPRDKEPVRISENREILQLVKKGVGSAH